ncbi:hypothetical protein MAR_002666 [Mya arenaria]|uniref:Uncharacterized protein n=1 Tax=Mya arenaria TaxID=6604 RepID=A0ABY7G3S2_MYAAR|nr:hypothetical protein MAR_002666 [Mya arenaria]
MSLNVLGNNDNLMQYVVRALLPYASRVTTDSCSLVGLTLLYPWVFPVPRNSIGVCFWLYSVSSCIMTTIAHGCIIGFIPSTVDLRSLWKGQDALPQSEAY